MKTMLVLGLSALSVQTAHADDKKDDKHHDRQQKAIEACAKSKKGDTCSITMRGHALSGTCGNVPDVKELLCRPTPPPQAVAACKDSKDGDACSFKLGDDPISGKCGKLPDEKALHCRPEHHRH